MVKTKNNHVITARTLTLSGSWPQSVNMSTETTHAWRPTDTLAARLILMRRELGLSQREAAEKAGIPFGQWQGMEDGHRQPRGLDVKIQRIALAFNVDRNWLMWGGPLSSGAPTPPSGPGTFAGSRLVNAFRRSPTGAPPATLLPVAA